MFAFVTAKSVAIFLGLASTAFCVATIVLAVQNADLENDLQDALDKIDALVADTTSTSTTTTTTTASPGVTTPTGSTGDGGVTNPSSSTAPGETSPGETSPGVTSPGGESSSSSGTTSTSANPIYPTLPTGLPDPEKIEWRLPTEIKPIKYKLFIQPDLKTGACEGTVSIQFQLEAVTNLIVLHAKDINVHSISILNMMARMRIAIDEITLDVSRELILIKMREVLSMSKAYTLSASFDYSLTSLTGAYISNYTNAEGVEK